MADNDTILKELREIKDAALLAAKPILTMDDAAAFMGVTKCNLYKLVSAKRIPHYKSEGGKFTYFKRVELEQWLTAVRVPTNSELEAAAAVHGVTKGGAL